MEFLNLIININIYLVPSFEITADILLVFLYLTGLKARQILSRLVRISVCISKEGATLFGHAVKNGPVIFGQLNLVDYLIEIRLDLQGLKL